MNVLISNLPIWAQDLVTWITTGSNIATLIGIIAALIRLSTVNKENKSVTNVQIDLLQQMVDKLSDTKDLANNLQQVSIQVSEALACFENSITMQKQANANLAAFVMECFNKSNLNDEAKTELKFLADKLFYDNNTAVIEALKEATAKAEAAAAATAEKVAQLEEDLANEKAKLAKAQENIKANRRL